MLAEVKKKKKMFLNIVYLTVEMIDLRMGDHTQWIFIIYSTAFIQLVVLT